MTEDLVECPQCGLPDNTVKVSRIYIEALESFRSKEAKPLLASIMSDPRQLEASGLLKTQALRSLVRSFGPPSGQRQIIRPVDPKLVMVGFTLMALFFMVQIYLTQRELFLPVLVLVLLFYLGYAVFRNQIHAKYEKQVQQNVDIKTSYEAAIGKWMQLYYCIRDEIVFDPRTGSVMALDAMEVYLFEQKTV
jgi:hypothetical protein